MSYRDNIAWTEIVDSTHRFSERTKAGSAFARGAVGGFLLGPIGALAGASSAKKHVTHEDWTTFVIYYKDGNRKVERVNNNSRKYRIYLDYVGAEKQYLMNKALKRNADQEKLEPAFRYQETDDENDYDENFCEEKRHFSCLTAIACAALCAALPIVGLYAYRIITQIAQKQNESQSVTSFVYAVTTEVARPKATPASTQAILLTATPAPIRGKITRGVNVRADATADSEKVGSLKQGETVTITKAYYNPKWHQILYEGEIRYISANYCEIEQ